MKLSRRTFITAGAVALGAAAAGAVMLREQSRGMLLSAFEDARADQYAGGVRLDTGRVFGSRIPVRAHGIAVHPLEPQRVLYFARRPGTQAFELRLDTLAVREILRTPAGRHLGGHGVFSADGSLLYTPEHDYEQARGIIAVRDSRDFRIIDEIDSNGLDPHEVVLLPDGRSLMVANGGILTHPRTFRRKLNLDTMDPSLCRIDAASGRCLEQWRLPDHQLSIRHLAVTRAGSVAAGLQYENVRSKAPGVVALCTPASGLRLLTAPAEELQRCDGYVASITISERASLIAAACPYGGGVACWSLASGDYLGFIAADEPYGLSRLADGSIVVSQRDGNAFALEESRLRSQFLSLVSEHAIRWDDHWVAAT